jgi:pimeloyl-ACP methyl ester carboxylesterase
MATAHVNGVSLYYYEETGSGFPLIWCHEFGGDYRSWEPQVRYFSRRYRVVTWNYRGYPPSEVPEDPAAYRNDILVEDLAALMRHLGIERAHVGGLSMGGNVALNFGIAHPDMSESLIICGCGSGTVGRETFLAEGEKRAQEFLAEGIEAKVRNFAGLASRRGFAEKDPRGWAEFLQQVRDHSPAGSAHMLRGVQMKRKTIFELEPELKRLEVPSLVVVGDQDEPCLEPSLFMKRHIPHAGLVMLPMTGHTANIEEPALFNLHVSEFLAVVENGRWGSWKAEKPGRR